MVIECRFVFADRGPFPYSVSAEEDALKMCCDSLQIGLLVQNCILFVFSRAVFL